MQHFMLHKGKSDLVTPLLEAPCGQLPLLLTNL